MNRAEQGDTVTAGGFPVSAALRCDNCAYDTGNDFPDLKTH